MDNFSFQDVFNEVIADIRYANTKYDESHPFGFFNFKHNAFFRGIIAFLPHMFGVLIGCAFAKMFGLGTAGFLILGLFFAFITGLIKYFVIDDIPIKRALVKDLIMLVFTFATYGLLLLVIMIFLSV